MKTVSVIIPFYKGKDWLIEALKSIDCQTVQPQEVIIINDGSHEDLSDLKERSYKLVIIDQTNQGAAKARNNGINIASGDYIAFLDSDDYWHSQKLEYQLNALDKTGCVWSYSSYNQFSDGSVEFISTSQEKLDFLRYERKKIYPTILNSCDIATPSVIVDRDVLIRSGFQFNESLRYGEDYCLWLKLAHDFPVVKVLNEIVFVRIHGKNAAKSNYVQLCARSDIHGFAKRELLWGKEVPGLTRFAYLLCSVSSKLVRKDGKERIHGRLKELMSGVLYSLPWIIFKVGNKVTK